jgi:hypothetical protein
LIGQDQIGDALHPGSIAPIFKRIAQWIGIPRRFVAQMSGHSTRVGAAQDLAELDIDDPSYVSRTGESYNSRYYSDPDDRLRQPSFDGYRKYCSIVRII